MSSFLIIQTENKPKPNAPKKTGTLSQLTGLMSVALMTLVVSTHTLAVPIEQGSLSSTANAGTLPSGTSSTTGTSADSQGSTLWQLYQQVQQLQQEVRELRGQMEAQQDGLDRTQKDLKNRYTDLDQRLELLKEQSQPAEEDANSDTSAQDSTPQKNQAETPSEAGSIKDTNEAAPAATPAATPEANSPASESPTSQPATSAPTNSSNKNTTAKKTSSPAKSTAKLVASATATSNHTEPDKQAYIGAYDAYKLGGAAKAIKPMQQFIASFPNSIYVPNAYYWLGEFYLAITPADFVKAKKSFNEVVNKYPKSSKAPPPFIG